MAALATSFNESAEHIEELVRHQNCWPCSHDFVRATGAHFRWESGVARRPVPETSAELARNGQLDALIR